jgi:hypothetical protein
VSLKTNCKYSVFDNIVVVGKGRSVLALYIAFQANVLAVALSFILISNTCAPVGVPVGAANVAAAAKAVTVNSSVVSQAGVGVAEDAIVLTLAVILLFVSVTVALFLVASLVSSTLVNPTCAFVTLCGLSAGKASCLVSVKYCKWSSSANQFKLPWSEAAVQEGKFSNNGVIVAVAALSWNVNLAANTLPAVNLFGSVVGEVSTDAPASELNSVLLYTATTSSSGSI